MIADSKVAMDADGLASLEKKPVMWLVPEKLGSMLDQPWRYGIFLGRALGSDQNFIGVNSSEVVCARTIVRPSVVS